MKMKFIKPQLEVDLDIELLCGKNDSNCVILERIISLENFYNNFLIWTCKNVIIFCIHKYKIQKLN